VSRIGVLRAKRIKKKKIEAREELGKGNARRERRRRGPGSTWTPNKDISKANEDFSKFLTCHGFLAFAVTVSGYFFLLS